jgi:hypothetical protein
VAAIALSSACATVATHAKPESLRNSTARLQGFADLPNDAAMWGLLHMVIRTVPAYTLTASAVPTNLKGIDGKAILSKFVFHAPDSVPARGQ